MAYHDSEDYDNEDFDDEGFDGDEEDEPTVSCPHCRRQIHEDAQRCPYLRSVYFDGRRAGWPQTVVDHSGRDPVPAPGSWLAVGLAAFPSYRRLFFFPNRLKNRAAVVG